MKLRKFLISAFLSGFLLSLSLLPAASCRPFPLPAAAPATLPAAGEAPTPGGPSGSFLPGGDLTGREKELLQELLEISLQLDECRRQSDQLAAKISESRQQAEKTGAELARTQTLLAARGQRLGRLLAFTYRYGEVSLLGVLLGTHSFSEFVSQSFYISAFLSRQAKIFLETRRLVAEKKSLLARLEQLQKDAAAEKALLDETAARAEQLKEERLRLLAEARRQSQDLARRLTLLEEQWGRLVGAINGAFRQISALPPESLAPDRLGFSGGSFYAEISASTLNRLLQAAAEKSENLKSPFAFVSSEGVTIGGSLSSPAASFVLRGKLFPGQTGKKVLFRPEGLEINGVPAEKEILSVVSREGISWDLGEYLPFLKISAIECNEGRIILTFSGIF